VIISNTTHILIALGVKIKEHFKRNVTLGSYFQILHTFLALGVEIKEEHSTLKGM